MDGVSIASSIISIASAGIQISIKLVTLSTQISSASERVSSIGNDISLTSGVLHQLGELMTQKTTSDGISIFSQGGLETTRTSAAMCERIFSEIEKEFGKASEQLRACRKFSGGKIKLSKSEKLKWPFLQPSIDILRADLREAKGTLMLMLQVSTLALSKKMADLNASASSEQADIFRAIIALQQQQDQKHLEAADTKTRLPGGSIAPASTKINQSSKPVTRLATAGYCSPTLTHSSSPKAAHTPPMPSSVRHSRVANGRQSNSGRDEPTDGNPANITTTLLQKPTELSVEGYNSSSVTLATQSSFNCTDTSTPASTMEISSIYEGTQGSGSPQDYQMQLMLLEKQNKKRLILEQQNREESNASPTPTKPKLPNEIDSELHMFMLKPIVKDYFDKIELSWSVQNPKMHVSTIRNQLARMEAEGLPSVMDMLETLYDHEHSMIDVHQAQGELLSLKRTKTDIQHRDIVFKGVPGLQFIVEPKKMPKDSGRNPESPLGLSEVAIAARMNPQAALGMSRTDSNDRPSGSLRPVRMGYKSTWREHQAAKEATEAASSYPTRAVPPTEIATDKAVLPIKTDFIPPARRKAKGKVELANLQGLLLNEKGLVTGAEGIPVARFVEGDLKAAAGRPLNSKLQIVDDFECVIGTCRLIPDNECEAMMEGPFSGLGNCVVVQTGVVEDEEGNTVGRIVQGDAQRLTGCALNEDGDIMDESGGFQGHAEPYEEPEEETDGVTNPESHLFGENAQKGTLKLPYNPSIFKDVDSTVSAEDERDIQEERLRKLETEMEKPLKEKLAEKESKYQKHEEELRARQLKLKKLDIQSSKLDEEKMRGESGQPPYEEMTNLPFKQKIRKKKRIFGLRIPPKNQKSAQTLISEKEQEQHVSDKHPAEPPMSKCQYDPCTYESKNESYTKQHMEEAHGWTYVRSKNDGRQKAATSRGAESPSTPRPSTPVALRSSPEVSYDHMGIGESMRFSNDLSDPNFLEDFDFEQFLGAQAFSFDADNIEKDKVTAPEHDPDTLSEFIVRSDVTRYTDLDYVMHDETRAEAETPKELQAGVKHLEQDKSAKERTFASLPRRNQLLEAEAHKLEEDIKDVKKEMEEQAGRGMLNESLREMLKLLEGAREIRGDITEINERLRLTDAKSSHYQREMQALESAYDQSRRNYEEIASKYAETKKELENLQLETKRSTTGDNANEAPANQIFKSFRVSMEEPVTKILPAAVKKYNLSGEPSEYALYIVYEDKELCLGRQDKPMLLFKQLDKEGRKPTFMLRRHSAPDDQELKTITTAGSTRQPYFNDFGEEYSIQEDSAFGLMDEEYSDDEDNEATTEKEDIKEMDPETERKIVDGLLGKYTTLFDYPGWSSIQLPGGVL